MIYYHSSDAFFWFGIEEFATKHANHKRGSAYQYFNTHRVIIMMMFNNTR